MQRFSSAASTDGESLPLLSRSDSSLSKAASSSSPAGMLKINVRRTPKATTTTGSSSPYTHMATPRSPFDEGFPMLFASPIPSPRPHRLSFSYAHRDDGQRQLHVFLTLLMSVVGAGMLSVPYTFLLVPTWQAVLGIVGVGVSMAATSTALLYAHVQLANDEERVLHIGAGKRFSSFQSIAVVAGGDTFGYVVSVVTAVGVYGGCVGCIRIVRDISPFIISIVCALFTATASLDASVVAHYAGYLLAAVFAVVVFPLCILKNLSALRVSSYLGFAFSLYLVAAIVFRSFHPAVIHPVPHVPTQLPGSQPTPQPTPLATTVSDTLTADLPFSRLSQSISIYNYAFMMQLNLLPLFIQLRGSFAEPLHTSARKMTRCIVGVSVFCVVLYVAFGLGAKHLYGDSIRGNILLNLESDAVMTVPLVAVFLTVVLSFPLLFHPLRGVIEELLFPSSVAHDMPTTTRLLTTAVLLLSQFLLALYVPGVEVVFALTGASSCLLICFVFPVVLFMRLFPWKRQRVLALAALWLGVAFFTVVGVDATWYLLA